MCFSAQPLGKYPTAGVAAGYQHNDRFAILGDVGKRGELAAVSPFVDDWFAGHCERSGGRAKAGRQQRVFGLQRQIGSCWHQMLAIAQHGDTRFRGRNSHTMVLAVARFIGRPVCPVRG
jgi:hypothetical protein